MQTQHRTGNNIHYDHVLSAWREQVTTVANGPDIKQRLLHQERELLPAFAAQYTRLSALPRTARRALQRQWKRSLAGVALLLALGQTPVMAATINVGGGCTLANAITAANTDAAIGGCAAGSGADRVVLPRGSTQTVSTASIPRCSLPPVESVITLAGNGSTIRAIRGRGLLASAICVYDGGNLALQRTTVTGAVYRGLSIHDSGRATLTNTTISKIAGKGAGIYNHDEGSLRVTNSTISGNFGPGLRNGHGNPNSKVTNSTISGNKYGGVDVADGTVTVTSSTISENSRDGGIQNFAGKVTLTNTTISGNSSSVNGGGVYNTIGSMTIINSTITGNSASLRGGGVSGFDYPYVYSGGDLTLKKTLIAGNSALNGAREVNFARLGTLTINDFNVFGFNGNAGISCCFKKGATDIVPRVGLGKVLNPALANNRGPTRTHALPAGSPAIDTVNDGTCPRPARDQRGTTRPRDGNGDGGAACDTGSVERGPRPAIPARSNIKQPLALKQRGGK